jgi:hypothetical protein
MLDDRVRAGEHQGGVTVVESHQVGRLPARSADLDDLARPPQPGGSAQVRILAWIPDLDIGERLPARRGFAQSPDSNTVTALAAGELVILPAVVATFEPEWLPGGSYSLTVLLTGLNPRSSPGTLHIT